MYIGEWLMWFSNSVSSAMLRNFQIPQLDKNLRPSELRKNYTKKSMSDTPRPIGPYYAYNEHYLEIRGGMFENFRGIITWISLLLFLIPLSNAYFAIDILIKHFNHHKDDFVLVILAASFNFILFIVFAYFFVRYFRHIGRFELFTLRHIRVRFNRVTKQVYIQRPKYLGGTVVFRWKDIMPICVDEENENPQNLVNVFYFHPYKTGLPFIDGFGIGKNTNSLADHRDEWEFIRRYMENGMDELPKPRITTTLPLPGRALKQQIKPLVKICQSLPHIATYIIMIPVFIVMLPFYIIGYFVSECLCWQARWPRVIREAGQKGKPRPKETRLTDYSLKIRQIMLQDESSVEQMANKETHNANGTNEVLE
ncbi:hypothetical protein JMI89_10185 [Frischella sp. Ac48]|uniref:DUF6708 domain-containing protein n=1 Tax=Frischella japonica TaxID=2741544 RepID=A0ABR7QZA2_9GAMM|nr:MULTISPECIES: DUF6708 domain-containing protein [Frischella]MBC9131547.1 hypothetical protein [Frischella japonica]MBX4133993.1 hypothetical protein [Frischella sp. Ac48]